MCLMLEKIDTIRIRYRNCLIIKIKFKVIGSGKEIKFSEVELDRAKDYAAEDADITYRLYRKFYKV